MAPSQEQPNPSNGDFTDLWFDALTAYQLETKRELPLERMKIYLKTPEDLLAYLESQGESFTNFREKHGKLWSRMHAFVAPITAIGSTASTAINSVAPFGPPASAVLGAVVYLIKAADHVKDAYDWIQTLFGEFEDFAVRLQQYVSPTLGLDTALQRKVVAILTCLLRLMGRSEALIKGGRFREYLKCTFLGKDEKTKGLLDDLNKQVGGEKGLVLALTYAATRNAEDYSKDAADATVRIEAAMDEQRKQEVDMKQIEHMKQILETPALDLVYGLLSTQSRDLVDGTGAWLEREQLFKDWINGRAPILWVFGGPGSGKSFLATWAVRYLRDRFDQTAETFCGTAVAFSFIKDYDAILLDPNNIFKTLAAQIAEVDVAFRDYAASICGSREATITEHATWTNIFQGFYSRPEAEGHCAILILDGLDEATQETRKTILDIVKQVTSTNKGPALGDRIQFGIFGRPELRSDLEFKRKEKYIEVSSSKNQDDVNNFINSKVPNLALVKEMRSKGTAGRQQAKKLSRTIVKQVLQGADGVFLWAKLLMKELEELDLTQMGKALKNPPRSLDDMIRKLFHRISRDDNIDITETNRMLTFICFSQRPLRFGELQLFLSLSGQQPQFLLWRNIRGRFASLFELKFPRNFDPDEEDDDDDDDDEDEDADSENGKDDDMTETGTTLCEEESVEEGDKIVEVSSQQGSDEGDNEDDDHDADNDIDDDKDEDEDEDEDDGEDFDFGDEDGNNGPKFDLGFMPRGEKEVEEYETTFHEQYDQLMTTVKFTHLRIKDFLLNEGRSSETKQTETIQVNPHRGEINLTLCCLQALRQGFEKQEHRAYLVEYAASHFVTHLANLNEEYLTKDEINEIITGLVQLFHSEQTSKSLLIGAGPGDETNTGRDEFWMMWMSSQKHREVVQEWLRRPEVDTLFTDQETLTWIEKSRTSVLTLLAPMIKGAAEIWLTKTGYDDEGYRDKSHWLVDVICGYLTMDETGTFTDDRYQEWSWIRGNNSLAPSSDTVRAAAEWANLEKTTHWYTGLGWILMDSWWHDEAILEYNRAIELDPKAWVAMEGSARCFESNESYEEAIEMMTRAIDNLPESMDSIRAYLLPQIADWRLAIGDTTGSYEAALEGFNTDSGSPIAQERYILALSMLDDAHQTIVDTLEWMHGCVSDNGHSWLTTFFMGGRGYSRVDEIGCACKICEKPAFLLEAMDQSISWSKDNESKPRVIWKLQQTARLRYTYYQDDDETVQLWEQCLDLISSIDGDEYLNDKIALVKQLSLLYFDMAVSAKRADEGFSKFAMGLKKLSIALESSLQMDSFEFYRSGYTALLWGRWLREHEGADVNTWRKPFRTSLLDQMNQLDDDDPANDTAALQALARGLFHAGDRENAGAILAIIFHILEDHIAQNQSDRVNEEEKDTNRDLPAEDQVTDDNKNDTKIENNKGLPKEAGKEPESDTIDPATISSLSLADTANKTDPLDESTTEGPPAKLEQQARKAKGSELKLAIDRDAWAYTCDNCREDAANVEELYFCEICEDRNWCGECLQLVKDGELPERQCNPQHDFYRAWPIPEEARHAAVTWLESEPELKREWLDALRKEWL